jgi:3-hydroxyacyl-CoA dehydrogenase/enoyl-CoA hydratase/3-hydroxybutyryl-CoA epimerase
MIGEALRCLEEGILHEPVDGDLGAVLGLGFPPFLGGPFRYVDRMTPAVLIGKMEQLESKYGARFSPPSILKDHADRNIAFYK